MPNNLTAEDRGGIQSAGLDFWMAAVTRQCSEVRQGFDPTPVHDLRVALRRCRSIANGFMALDPHPAWKQMKTESKRLFQQLGALRETQVMSEWVQRLAPVPDATSLALKCYLETEENRHREDAASAVLDFDKKKWMIWARLLSGRTRNVPLEGAVFQHLALDRWFDLQALHHQAVRNRSQAAYHRVRLALKKFRYTVENFLPSRHEKWEPELRELQDILGEMHDLDVLWRTALAIKAIPSQDARKEWRQRMLDERRGRLEKYRAKMIGKTSLLFAWRDELPRSDRLRDAALVRFRAWASLRDPDAFASEHVAKLALQIYDGLASLSLIPGTETADGRRILEMAAISRAIGSMVTQNKYQIASGRLIHKLQPLAGLDDEMLPQIALVVRFHRGSLPRSDQKALSGLSNEQRASVVLMSGILRLADAFGRLHGIRVTRLRIDRSGDTLFITAPGYSARDISAEKLAAARHLLENACHMPILIRGSVPKPAIADATN